MLQNASLNTPADGVRAALPVVFAYLPVGFAAGILAAEAGMSALEVALLSLLVFAGSGQFIFAGLLGGSPAALVITIFLVNFRHFLYATAFAQRLKKLSLSVRLAIGAQLTDETFALASVLCRQPMSVGGGLIALNVTSYTAWFIGNVAGALTGAQLAVGEWGADFLLLAMFAALLAINTAAADKRIAPVVVLIVAAVIMVALELIHPHPLNILLAAGVAAGVGVLCFGPANAPENE